MTRKQLHDLINEAAYLRGYLERNAEHTPEESASRFAAAYAQILHMRLTNDWFEGAADVVSLKTLQPEETAS